MKKFLAILFSVVLAVSFAVGLSACNKKDDSDTEVVDLSQYFVQNEAAKDYTGYEKLVTLPENVELQNRSLTASSATASSQNYPAYRTNYSSYVDGYGGFVLTNSEYTNTSGSKVSAGLYHGFYKVGDDDVTIPVQYVKIHFSHGVIAVMNSSGEIGVFDADGNTLIACGDENFALKGSATASSSYKLSTYVEVLSENYVATVYKKSEGSTSAKGSFLRIFSLKTGKQVASFSGLETGDVDAFDNYLVVKRTVNSKDNLSVVAVDDSSSAVMTLADVPQSGQGFFEEFTTTTTDLLVTTYLGGGKFFVLNRTSGTETDHTYRDLTEKTYYNCSQYIYDAATKTRSAYTGKYIFVSLVNSYYADDIELDINGFLKKGYTFGTYVLYRADDKTTSFDQVILDQNMNVCVSLSYTMGYTANEDEITAGVSDIAMTFTGEYATAVEPQGVVRMYDKNGKVLLEKSGDYNYAHISGENLIVGVATTSGSSVVTKFGIMSFDGKTILPAEYNYVTDFTEGYALAVKYTTSTDASTYSYVVVDKKGNKVQDISYLDDMAVTSGGTPLYMNGIYAYKVTITAEDSTSSWYGLRNLVPDTTEAQIFPDLFSKITVVRTNNSSENDVKNNHAQSLYAFTQATSGGRWTIYSLA